MSAGETEYGTQEKKRILIVDDDPTYAKMVREWLKEIYQVSVVVNAAQVVTYLGKHPVDLVLLDYEMPNVSGPEVLRMLRKNTETADVSVVFLTGVESEEKLREISAMTPAGCLKKSTPKNDIVAWLAAYFG